MTFSLSSPAFVDGAQIPSRHTCEGEDLSPPLRWQGAPDGTESFALLCDDPDAPGGTWHHWAAYDLPSAQESLDEGFPADTLVGTVRQAVNDFGRSGYGGPCPPPGHGTHHYHFRLLALSVAQLDLGPKAGCRDVEAAARPHVLGEARLLGTYAR